MFARGLLGGIFTASIPAPARTASNDAVNCPALWVPIIHPCWSGSMLVFVEDAAKAVASADNETRDLLTVGHRFGERTQGCSSLKRPAGVLVTGLPGLPQRVPEVALVLGKDADLPPELLDRTLILSPPHRLAEDSDRPRQT